jgi:hypothetical protein
MLADVQAKQSAMTKSISDGSAQSAAAATTNFTKFAQAVQAAMQSGVVSASKGSQLIGEAINATLKAFGAKPINVVGLTSKQPTTVSSLPGLQGTRAGRSCPGLVAEALVHVLRAHRSAGDADDERLLLPDHAVSSRSRSMRSEISWISTTRMSAAPARGERRRYRTGVRAALLRCLGTRRGRRARAAATHFARWLSCTQAAAAACI